jgi:hypothetical protein
MRTECRGFGRVSGRSGGHAEHQVVHNEEGELKTIELRDRYGEQHIAVGCSRQLKKWTQGEGGPQKKLPAATPGIRSSGTRQGHVVH